MLVEVSNLLYFLYSPIIIQKPHAFFHHISFQRTCIRTYFIKRRREYKQELREPQFPKIQRKKLHNKAFATHKATEQYPTIQQERLQSTLVCLNPNSDLIKNKTNNVLNRFHHISCTGFTNSVLQLARYNLQLYAHHPLLS